MSVTRLMLKLALAATVVGSSPAPAQFFLRNPDLSGPPMRGDEPELGYTLPGATPAELRAGMTWSMRAALNVAALQCQFEPVLMSVQNYNAVLIDHKAELADAMTTLSKYFIRVNKTKARGMTALDQFSTRLYAGFSTVSAQYIFCLTAGSIAQEAVFTKRGKFADVASARMGELRRSLKPAGEQQFPGRYPMSMIDVSLPQRDCLDRKGRWDTRKCGERG